MRAVLCKEWGGPEKLVVEDVPSPVMKDGAVRIAVQAAGINFADLLLISGLFAEGGMTLWLLLKGVNVPAWRAQARGEMAAAV